MIYYVAMRCEVHGPLEAVSRFRELVFREDRQVYHGKIKFDFEQVIPMPRLSCAQIARLQKAWGSELPADRAYCAAMVRAGQTWRECNWGAYSCGHEIQFKGEQPLDFTMNARAGFPEPIFVRLAQLFPELSFNCAFHGFYDLPSDSAYAHLQGDDRRKAGQGWFNPPPGKPAFQYGKASEELIEFIGRDRSVRRWTSGLARCLRGQPPHVVA